jgi:hypothetical protein
MVTIGLSTETFRLSLFGRIRPWLIDTHVVLGATSVGMIALAAMVGSAAIDAATRPATLTAIPKVTCAHPFADDVAADSTGVDQFPAATGTGGSGKWFYKTD